MHSKTQPTMQKANAFSCFWTNCFRRVRGVLCAAVLVSLLASGARADQSVTLAWDPNPEPDVSGYVVYYGTQPRSYPLSTNVGNVTTATVYGLKEGLTHFFAITARNTSGLESDFSNEVTNAIPASVTNRVPSIDPIGDMVIVEGVSTNTPVYIWDVETPFWELQVTATSTNQALLPDDRIVVEGTNHTRTLYLEPALGQSGQTLITITVSDDSKASSTSFLLTVLPRPKQPEIWIRTIYQVGPTRNGPWQWVTSEYMPIQLNTNLFYRTW